MNDKQSLKLIQTEQPKETALVVGVDLFRSDDLLTLEESLEELELLAITAGVEVVGTITQNLTHPNPKTFIGSGKVQEVKMLAEELDVDLIIFDDELSPSVISVNWKKSLAKSFG